MEEDLRVMVMGVHIPFIQPKIIQYNKMWATVYHQKYSLGES